MGCVQSNERKAISRSDEIDLQLKHDKTNAWTLNTGNILLLDSSGAGEMVLGQMKLAQIGYNDSERALHKQIIFHNTIQSMREILESISKLHMSLQPMNESRGAYVLSLPLQFEGESLPYDVADAIRGLWSDPSVREVVCMSKENLIMINRSAEYYFDEIDRMSASNYLPTNRDILRSPVKMSGVSEAKFCIEKRRCKIIHPSGQQPERRKWLQCFENVSGLIFCVSLSDYDQVLPHDKIFTRLHKALEFFDSVCNSRWFTKTSIILVFNNIKTFAEKLPNSPLGNFFTDYTGGEDYDAALSYLKYQFMSLTRSQALKERVIYVHFIDGPDTLQIKWLYSAIEDLLLQRELQDSGLLDLPMCCCCCC